MKRILDWFKDLLYDGIDYLIMLVIVLAVVLIINWRLEGLFTSNLSAANGENGSKIEDNLGDPETPDKENPENIDGETNEENPDEDKPENNENSQEQGSLVKSDTTITIPQGSYSGEIANIVASNGLVASSQEFIDKAVSMNLDRSLQAGTFLIPEGSRLEDIIRIIARR